MIRIMGLAATLMLFSGQAFANYVGSEVQYFNPTTDSLDFFTVHSSRTLPKGSVKTTLFFDYAENIHYSDTVENAVTQAQLGFGLGLTDRMSFSVAGSGIINYDEEVGGAYTTEDVTYIRAGIKYRLSGDSQGGFALIANLGFGLMSPDYFVGNEDDFGASITFAYDRMLGEKVRFATNLGYRYRNSDDNMATVPPANYGLITTTPRDGSDVLFSIALNYMMSRKWTAVTEVYSSLPVDQFFDFTVDNDTYDQKGAEFLLGFNYSVSDKMDLGFGGAAGLFSDAQNADWRVFLGMGYTFGGAYEDAAFNLAGNASAPIPVLVEKAVEKAPEVAIEDAPVLESFDITAKFISGSATLTGSAKTQVDRAAMKLRQAGNNYRMIYVEGHTDSSGSDEANKALSQKRADSVKNYLVKAHSIPMEKIQSVGFGETSPIADNSTAAGRSANRRVVIKVK